MIIALLATIRPAILSGGGGSPDSGLLLISGDEQTGTDYLQLSYLDELAGPDRSALSGDFE